MKIIFFTTEDKNLPGARRCHDFAMGLAEKGVETEVISCSEYLNIKSLRNLYINDIKKVLIQIKIYKRIFKEKSAVFYLQRINYHFLAPFLVKKLYNNKIILDIDDWFLDANIFRGLSLFKNYKIDNLAKFIIKRSYACITISKKLYEFISKFNNNIFYIPVLTEISFQTQKINNFFIFSWMGTIYREDDLENLKFIINSFKKFYKLIKEKNVYLEILGGGSLFYKIKEIDCGENIKIRDWINPTKIKKYLINIDVGLIPLLQDSYYNTYKTPTKLFEYMASNKAVIVSNIGETGRFVIDNKCGFALPNIEEKWAEYMILIYKDAKKRKKFGNNGYNLVKNKYSFCDSIDILYNIVKGIYEKN